MHQICITKLAFSAIDACNSSFQDERSQTPPSAAVTTAVQQILPEAPSPLLDNGTPGPNDTSIKSQKHEKDDSWVENVKSCTPAETTSGEGNSVREVILVNHDQCNDSFVEQIETRTPGKRISRIEDSVEALDALEEEIEKVGESLPTASNKVRSLIKAEKHAKGPKKATDTNVHGSVRIKKALGCLIDTTKEKSNTNARSSVSKAPFQSSIKKTTSLRSSVAHVKPAATLEGSVTQTIPDEKKTALKKRVSSVHKAPFQPSKSAKPPTRAAFELPGEALSRKLKGQREDRLKREEEEKTKKRVFKARPVRISQAPEVKLTAATKARLSLAKAGTSNDMNPIQDATDDKMNVSARSTAPNVANKRFSTLSVAKRTSQGLTHAPRKPSTNSAVAPVRRPSTTPRAPSAMDTSPPIPSTEDLAYQRSKGKEVFARTRIEIMEREKARKEKEEAARKARADAAERGRVASREWAEKQKKKKLEVAKGDKEGKSVVA